MWKFHSWSSTLEYSQADKFSSLASKDTHYTCAVNSAWMSPIIFSPRRKGIWKHHTVIRTYKNIYSDFEPGMANVLSLLIMFSLNRSDFALSVHYVDIFSAQFCNRLNFFFRFHRMDKCWPGKRVDSLCCAPPQAWVTLAMGDIGCFFAATYTNAGQYHKIHIYTYICM